MKYVKALWLVMTLSMTAQAVCVNGYPSVASEFRHSNAVVLGTAISQRKVPEDGYFADGTMYQVRVKKRFKGGGSRSIEIFSENSTGKFDLAIGDEYLLFLYEDHGRLNVDNCGNSGLASKKASAVQQVAKLSNSEK